MNCYIFLWKLASRKMIRS